MNTATGEKQKWTEIEVDESATKNEPDESATKNEPDVGIDT